MSSSLTSDSPTSTDLHPASCTTLTSSGVKIPLSPTQMMSLSRSRLFVSSSSTRSVLYRSTWKVSRSLLLIPMSSTSSSSSTLCISTSEWTSTREAMPRDLAHLIR